VQCVQALGTTGAVCEAAGLDDHRRHARRHEEGLRIELPEEDLATLKGRRIGVGRAHRRAEHHAQRADVRGSVLRDKRADLVLDAVKLHGTHEFRGGVSAHGCGNGAAIFSLIEMSSCFRLSKSTTSRSEFVKPCFCLRAAFSALSASFSLLALVSRSRSFDNSESKDASESRVTLFSALTNCSFSLMWVSTCTFDVFFFLSL